MTTGRDSFPALYLWFRFAVTVPASAAGKVAPQTLCRRHYSFAALQ
jgi:hypothetical protein